MKPQKKNFYEKATSTFTYVANEGVAGNAAIIDSVLDFDAAAAGTLAGAI